ncbi:MAG: hypothetical protein L3J36_03120 [Rhodobacteraceae bacterium]|nr:hypothetical protein [Paracoccaceae bacterium]
MDTLEYNLRVNEVARAVMHPADDHAEIVRKVRNFTSRGLIVTRHRDPNDKRGAYLLAAPDALIAAILLRLYDTGLHDKKASEAVAIRLHTWNEYDFDPGRAETDPIVIPENAPRDPAAHIWESFCADPRGTQFNLTLRWWRNIDTGARLCRTCLFKEGDGLLGKEYDPGPDWEIMSELVIVMDKILTDLRQRLNVIKKLN